jgi:Tol biopolymer transport system component
VLAVQDGESTQLWMLDLARGTQSRLTFDDAHYTSPCWTNDGMFVISGGGPTMSAQNLQLHLFSVEGLVPPQVLAKGTSPTMAPGDGAILFTTFEEQGSWNLLSLDLTAPDGAQAPLQVSSDPVVVAGGPSWQYGGVVSSDGGLVAYVSRETGRDEVYLRRYPQGDQKRQVSVEGGGWPQWNGTGDRLYFMSGLNVVEVVVERQPAVRLGTLKTLFTRERGEDQFGVGWPLYLQVSGDGESFFMLHQADEEMGNRPLMVVERWSGQ